MKTVSRLVAVATLLLLRSQLDLTIAAEPKPATQESAARDAGVLQTVFDDMLSKDNSESPVEWHGDQSEPVYVSRSLREWRPTADRILQLSDEKKWNALTKHQIGSATEAADDLVARVAKRDPLPDLKSTSGRVKVYEDAGAATQPTREKLFPPRASHVLVPGYSKDRRFAVVHLSFPWSGMMHSGVATYILERTDGGWNVVLRDFIYYV
jgi:hypothetical protein